MPKLMEAPFTPTEPVIEVLHGLSVSDPYRWLEDRSSPRTRQWIREQMSYTRAYLDAIPGRAEIRNSVADLLSANSIHALWNVGERYFFLKRAKDSEQAAIAVREGLFGKETILLDPASRATGACAAVAIAAISHDGRFLAYHVRHGGTDHSAVEIVDVQRNAVLPDGLPEGSCRGFAFAADGSGFYYSHRALNEPRPNYKAVFWHCFGTKPSEDQEVFFVGENPNLFLGILYSPEVDLLAYVASTRGKHRQTSVYLHRRSFGTPPELLLENVEGNFAPFFAGDRLFAYTDLAAPNFRIVAIDIRNPTPRYWQNIVPESDKRIQQFAVAGAQIFVSRVDRFSTRIEAFDLNGEKKGQVPLPPHTTINLLNLKTTNNKLFFNRSSVSEPFSAFYYDTLNEKVFLLEKGKTPFDSAEIAVQEATYLSKDGTSVPLFLAARKDLLNSGPLPTFITGYGGFGSCVTPRFTAFATFLIEQGFLLAVPALRGGSELGEQWHLAGRREKRQNSFDDLIAAVDWLLAKRRSRPGHIAIGGGSNAGLLVGAAITQRPDLFRAAVCLGPLLDMARYHLFDSAAKWAEEYGSPQDEQEFRSLMAYSPYHRVQKGVHYPAVLLISGDADTRCNPMHALKMAARLQAANSSGHPILLDYKEAWGHTPVQPLSTKIEGLTDRLAFVCHEMGLGILHGRFS